MDNRITIDPMVCHGKPVVTNTRVLVCNILADLAEGESICRDKNLSIINTYKQ